MNVIKALIRWWDDPNHRGYVIVPLVFITASVFVGYAAGSVFWAIFWLPYFMAIVLITGIVVGLPAGLLIYVVFDGIPNLWKRLRAWAYEGKN